MNWVSLGIFGMLLLAVMSIISNSSSIGITSIQDQMYLMNCPFPIYNGVATLSPIQDNLYPLNYTVTSQSDLSGNFNGTKFECQLDLLSTPHYNINTVIYNYGYSALWGAIPYGWIGYVSDTLSVLFQKVQAFFTLLSFFITPMNFNILGYTIADITGIGLLVIGILYAFCYLSIGAMVYTTVLSAIQGIL